jgi:hypothetical protein
MSEVRSDVCFRGQSGRYLLALSFSAFDLVRALSVPQWRTADIKIPVVVSISLMARLAKGSLTSSHLATRESGSPSPPAKKVFGSTRPRNLDVLDEQRHFWNNPS